MSEWLCTKSRTSDSFSLRRSVYLCGLCVEMMVKRRESKLHRGPQRRLVPKLTFCAKQPSTDPGCIRQPKLKVLLAILAAGRQFRFVVRGRAFPGRIVKAASLMPPTKVALPSLSDRIILTEVLRLNFHRGLGMEIVLVVSPRAKRIVPTAS